ncbi:MAG TPA: DUF4302 domain-containing protein [Chitinophaga sp.]|uniref:DUF4302 domain-containing protein n=1 Tax=Chitinophaga sp. TaxID=1869181 RepID=UPI002CCAE5AE|nr:DUF4302 domain-containing protein [Chitinophaga sp.]HVI46497.1 DUF4302 domain-containing protein [Chitinophaga sp.]
MKKYLAYTLLIAMMAPSCKKDLHSSVFDESTDQRLNAILAKYQSTLVAAPYGWVAAVAPAAGDEVYTYWFKFNDSNRVSSRWLDKPAVGSSYRLKALQQPELIFDTYTYLHLLADAEGKVPGAKTGVGLQSDFEFEILSGTADSFVLKGKYNGIDAKLLKAAAKDTTGNVVLPGYPLAGNFKYTSVRTLYTTTQAAGVVASVSRTNGVKTAPPLKYDATVSIDYSDLGASVWKYYLTLKNITDTDIAVDINPVMKSGIKQGSFKILEKSYDPVSGRIYLKTFYTNSAGAERVTEETFIRQ